MRRAVRVAPVVKEVVVSMDRLVPIRVFSDRFDAELARTRLERAGIEHFFGDDGFPGDGARRLMIHPKDLASVKKLLEAIPPRKAG